MNKLDLIIDALEQSKPINKESSISFDKHLKALAAARELRALEPIARFNWNEAKFEWLTKYDYHKHHMTPLYALGGEE